MSEARGRSREDPMPKGQWSRGVTPHPRSEQQLRVPGYDGTGTAERSYPTSEVRGNRQEEQSHLQGAVATQAQESLEVLSHVEGQQRGQ